MPIYVLGSRYIILSRNYHQFYIGTYYIIMKVLGHFYLKPLKPKMSKAHLILTRRIIFKSIEKAKLYDFDSQLNRIAKLNLLTS